MAGVRNFMLFHKGARGWSGEYYIFLFDDVHIQDLLSLLDDYVRRPDLSLTEHDAEVLRPPITQMIQRER